MNSRIFEEYLKIATAQGLVKEAADDGHQKIDMSKKEYSTREKYERPLTSAEILYGLTPNDEKQHIMEVAHPDPVVLAPAYDKINGLVENNLERQSIIVNQLGWENNGLLLNRKLAEQNLIFELVRLAGELDIKGQDNLRALADASIEQLSTEQKRVVKADWLQNLRDMAAGVLGQGAGDKVSDVGEVGSGAAAGAVAGGVIGGVLGGVFGVGVGALPGMQAGAMAGAAIGGLVSAFTKTGPTAVSVSRNCDVLMDEVSDLLAKFHDNFLVMVREGASDLKKASEAYARLLSEKNATAEHSEEVTKQYLNQMTAMKALAHDFQKQVASGKYKEEHNKLVNFMYNFMNSDEADVQKALNSLLVTIESAEKAIKSLKEEYSKATADAAKPEAKPTAAPMPAPTTQAPAADKPLFSVNPNDQPLIDLK